MPLSVGDKLGPYVAIKVSAAQCSEPFEREAQAIAALYHQEMKIPRPNMPAGSLWKMRRARRIISFLLAVGALPALSDTLPPYCGPVGAGAYTPPAVTIPAVVLNRGTVITVTNATVVVNGDTSSVQALAANPGPDGISIQEAILATNNDPGT